VLLKYYWHLFMSFRKSLYNAIFYGIMSGFADGIFYFLYAVLFRYGAFAITVDSDNVASIDYRSMIMLVTSF